MHAPLIYVIVTVIVCGAGCALWLSHLLNRHVRVMAAIKKSEESKESTGPAIDYIIENGTCSAQISQADAGKAVPLLRSFFANAKKQAESTGRISMPLAIEHTSNKFNLFWPAFLLNGFVSTLLILGIGATITCMYGSFPSLTSAIGAVGNKNESEEAKLENYTNQATEFFKKVQSAYLPSAWAIGGMIVLLSLRGYVIKQEGKFVDLLDTFGHTLVNSRWPSSQGEKVDHLSMSISRMSDTFDKVSGMQNVSDAIISALPSLSQELRTFTVQGGGMDRALNTFKANADKMRRVVLAERKRNSVVAGDLIGSLDTVASESRRVLSGLDQSRVELEQSLKTGVEKVSDWTARSVEVAEQARDFIVEGKNVVSQVASNIRETATSIDRQTEVMRELHTHMGNALSGAATSVASGSEALQNRLAALEQRLADSMGRVEARFAATVGEMSKTQEGSMHMLVQRLESLEQGIGAMSGAVIRSLEASTAMQQKFLETAQEIKETNRSQFEIGRSLGDSIAEFTQSARGIHDNITTMLPRLAVAVEDSAASTRDGVALSRTTLAQSQEVLGSARAVLDSASSDVTALAKASADLNTSLSAASLRLSETNERLGGAIPEISGMIQRSEAAASSVAEGARFAEESSKSIRESSEKMAATVDAIVPKVSDTAAGLAHSAEATLTELRAVIGEAKGELASAHENSDSFRGAVQELASLVKRLESNGLARQRSAKALREARTEAPKKPKGVTGWFRGVFQRKK